jgi:hypothetical protein
MKTKILIGLGLMLAVLGGIYFTLNTEQVVGSAVIGNEYQSYRITSGNASTSAQLVKLGPGTLGSIIVSSSTTGTLEVYDGVISGKTLTGAALTPGQGATTTATTTVALFPTNAVAGTYTFDSIITKSLYILPSTNFVGSYTITYR